MKRLYSELSPLSDETEPVIKRPRLLVSSLSSTFEIDEAEEEIINDESINSIDSQSEDDINEIVYENINSPCQQIDSRILILSDSDSDDDDDRDIDISFSISPTINILISPSLSNSVETLEEEEEINIENDHELIDLTEDEPNSTCCSSNKHEHQSSIDDEQCPICLETLFDLQSIGVYLIITPCHHVMCTLCSHELLATSSRCPLCRKNISSTTLLPYCILP